jgi:dihydroflavonol-4-reductase
VTALGATAVAGDLSDGDSLVRAMQNVQSVFHVAGINEMCLKDPAPMFRANVDGTRAVLRAARATDVRRLVFTSSAVTLGEPSGMVGSEKTPHRGFYLSDYEKSKCEAERLVFAEAADVEVVSVNPSSVQGPGRASGTGRLLLAAARGRLPFIVDAPLSLVDIDDCARGHLLAEQRGVSGQRYVLNGFTIEARRAIELLEAAVGVSLPVRFLPSRLVTAGALVIESGFRLVGKHPPICRSMVRVVLHGHRYDGGRATRDLGLSYRSVEETIERTVEWFRSDGLLN